MLNLVLIVFVFLLAIGGLGLKIWSIYLQRLTLRALVILAKMIRKKSTTDVDTVLDAIDDMRNQVDNGEQHQASEHKSLFETMKTISGRLQFMLARSIADHLTEERRRALERAQTDAAQKWWDEIELEALRQEEVSHDSRVG